MPLWFMAVEPGFLGRVASSNGWLQVLTAELGFRVIAELIFLFTDIYSIE